MFPILLICLLLGTNHACPASGVWEETPEGQIATVSCNLLYGVSYYEGNLTRLCSGSTMNDWGLIIENCTYVKPTNIVYPSGVTYELGKYINIVPTYEGFANSWSIVPALPTSLSWNSQTGAISGTLEEEIGQAFTITASNPNHSTSVVFILRCIFNGCNPDGIWPATLGGATSVHSCVDDYRYVGNLTRACEGLISPTWGAVIDNCVLGPPINLTYPYSTLFVYGDYPIPQMVPSYRGKGVAFFSHPAFPEGVVLDEKTGEIQKVGAIQRNGCTDILIGLRNEVGSCNSQIRICTIPKEEEEKDDRLGNRPMRLFWNIMTVSIVVLTLTIVLSIPYCICMNKRNKKKLARKQSSF